MKTMELEHAVAIREARLRIRELDRTLDDRDPGQEPAAAEPTARPATRRPPPPTLNRPRRILPEADSGTDATDENP